MLVGGSGASLLPPTNTFPPGIACPRKHLFGWRVGRSPPTLQHKKSFLPGHADWFYLDIDLGKIFSFGWRLRRSNQEKIFSKVMQGSWSRARKTQPIILDTSWTNVNLAGEEVGSVGAELRFPSLPSPPANNLFRKVSVCLFVVRAMRPNNST